MARQNLIRAEDGTIRSVNEIVAVIASKFRTIQQLSTSESQQVQQEAVTNNKTQQISTGFETWFGDQEVGGSNPLAPTILFKKLAFILSSASPLL